LTPSRPALPKPKDPEGYSKEEIAEICMKLGIDKKDFWDSFGINTVRRMPDGTHRFYVCDVERTLYNLGFKEGYPHAWD
jgi:hypothetical protein